MYKGEFSIDYIDEAVTKNLDDTLVGQLKSKLVSRYRLAKCANWEQISPELYQYILLNFDPRAIEIIFDQVQFNSDDRKEVEKIYLKAVLDYFNRNEKSIYPFTHANNIFRRMLNKLDIEG